MQQVTFRISDLKKLIGAREAGNILVTVNEGAGATASVVQKESASMMTTTDPAIIDGCPYPPGCTEVPAP